MNNKQNSRFFFTSKKIKLSGTPNGCCAIIKKEGVCELYSAKGKNVLSLPNILDGMLLNDGGYFTKHLPTKDSPRGCSFLANNPVWSLFDKEHNLIMTDIDECEVYANGWYRIIKSGIQTLYRDNHEIMAKDFSQCVVFSGGYGLRCNEKYYQHADWKIYTPDGTYVCLGRNTVAILGNGLLLQQPSPHIREYMLYNPATDELIEKATLAYQTFPNGRFVLTTDKPHYGKLSHLFKPDGTRLGISIQNAEFLPDGRFLQFHNGRLSALHRINGLLETEKLWTAEIAGNYYLLGFFGGTTLYNDKGEDLGEGYELVSFKDNFTLTTNEGEYHLFNQFGEVLTFPEE